MDICRMPGVVYSGAQAMEQLGVMCGGKKTVVFTDRGIERSGVLDLPLTVLKTAGAQVTVLADLAPEPTCDQAQGVVEQFLALHAERIVAVGGGSVMDMAKLCSILSDGDHTVRDLLETPSLGHKGVSTVMIPTTAGTGAEATPNAIVAVPEKELKVGIVCPEMIPDAVILDGEMIRRLPMKIAAATGVDALCHAIECYTSRKATPFSNMFAMEALKLIFPNIVHACKDPGALAEKNAMLLAAFYAGVAISCSGTTAVHALSYPLGGKYHIAHGVSNAMMLMPVMRFNLPYCLAEFAQVYDALGERGADTTEGKAAWLLAQMDAIVKELEIPTALREYGVPREDLDTLVKSGMEVQRLLVNNKRTVTEADAHALYLELLEEK